jgi:uncharacterized RDD family membrane protein YckC
VLIQLTVLGLLGLAAVFLAGAVGGGAGTVALIIMLIMVLVVIVGYPLAMESLWNGRTLGKAALGLRVVTVEGGPVRVRQSATRAIIGVFELWITFGSVAVLSTILTRDNQRLGDLVGGTLVLRERAAMSTTATAMSFPAPYGYADYVASIDVSVLTSDQYGVIRTFLMRVLDLTVEARRAGRQPGQLDRGDLHHPAGQRAPELFLVCVASAYQARHGGVVPSGPGWGTPGPNGGTPAARLWPAADLPPPPSYGQPPTYAPPQPTYGQQPGYGQGQPPVYAPPPSSPPYPGSAPPPAAPASGPPPPSTPAPAQPTWASSPVPTAPPKFDAPPAWPPAPPPRFDVPPADAGSGVAAPAEPVAAPEPQPEPTIGAEPAPWPPRKPGPHPSTLAAGDDEPSPPEPPPGDGPPAMTPGGSRLRVEPDRPVPFRGARLPRPLGVDAHAPRCGRGHAAVAHRAPRHPSGAPTGP